MPTPHRTRPSRSPPIGATHGARRRRQAKLDRSSPIAAYGGRLAWSSYDAATKRYTLVTRAGGVTAPVPIAPRPVPFDVDLGPRSNGAVAATYTRCQLDAPPAERARGCDVYLYDFSTGRETRVVNASAPDANESWPSLWRDKLAFARDVRRQAGPRLPLHPLDRLGPPVHAHARRPADVVREMHAGPRLQGDAARPLRDAPGVHLDLPRGRRGPGTPRSAWTRSVAATRASRTRAAAASTQVAARLARVRGGGRCTLGLLLRRPGWLPRAATGCGSTGTRRRADVVARPAEPAQPRARGRADLPARPTRRTAATAWATPRCPAAPARSRPASASATRALSSALSSIAGVRRPVNVFCWLGWKQPSSGSHAPSSKTASWPKRGRGRGAGRPARGAQAQRGVPGEARPGRPPRAASRSSSSSATAKGRQVSRSAGVGLLAGGAQRTAAVIQAPRSAQAVAARARDVGWLAKPARCSAANRKSPERSPVNTRPVRLAPCAAGARPRIRTRAAGSPKPGIGRPQYSSPANAARFSRATLLAPLHQPRARAAADDLGLEGTQAGC